MTSIEERWGMTEEELGAIFSANAAKARPFVYMSDSDDPYEDEDDNGLETPPPECITALQLSRRPRAKPPAATEVEHMNSRTGRITKRKAPKKSPRYPFTRSRGCEMLSLDLHKKGFVKYKPAFKVLNISFKTYMRDHDPDAWSHLTPEEHREKNFNNWWRKQPSQPYRILPDGTFQAGARVPKGMVQSTKHPTILLYEDA